MLIAIAAGTGIILILLLTWMANRPSIYAFIAVAVAIPLLALCHRSVVAAIAPATVMYEWLTVAYIAGALLMVAAVRILTAGRQPVTFAAIARRRRYAAEGRRRVARRVRIIRQEGQQP